MRLPLTARFDEESQRYALQFCCEECGYFVRASVSCAHEWPTELHRRARLAGASEVVFCKEFEPC